MTDEIAFYDEEEDMARIHAETYFSPSMQELIRRQNERLIESFPSSGRVLDVGCGVGPLLLSLPDRYRYVGIDTSVNALETVRDRFDHDVVRSDSHDLPFDADTFDVVVCRQVLHHFRSPAAVLEEARRVTAPDGRIVLFEGAPESPFRRSVLRIADALGVEHQVSEFEHRTRAQLVDLLEGAGFEVLQRRRIGGSSVPLAFTGLLRGPIATAVASLDASVPRVFHWHNLVVGEQSD